MFGALYLTLSLSLTGICTWTSDYRKTGLCQYSKNHFCRSAGDLVRLNILFDLK